MSLKEGEMDKYPMFNKAVDKAYVAETADIMPAERFVELHEAARDILLAGCKETPHDIKDILRRAMELVQKAEALPFVRGRISFTEKVWGKITSPTA